MNAGLKRLAGDLASQEYEEFTMDDTTHDSDGHYGFSSAVVATYMGIESNAEAEELLAKKGILPKCHRHSDRFRFYVIMDSQEDMSSFLNALNAYLSQKWALLVQAYTY